MRYLVAGALAAIICAPAWGQPAQWVFMQDLLNQGFEVKAVVAAEGRTSSFGYISLFLQKQAAVYQCTMRSADRFQCLRLP
jgi:hypothetical protein